MFEVIRVSKENADVCMHGMDVAMFMEEGVKEWVGWGCD